MRRMPARPLLLLALLACVARAEECRCGPDGLREAVRRLRPGDVLELEPGEYPQGLTLDGVHGTADAWITIRGPVEGDPARFPGSPDASRNTVEVRDARYVAIENLLIDGGGIEGIFAIHAAGGPVHHIRIEGCRIVGHGASQQTVAISTKVPTWGWIIRRNVIEGAGTGMYLGNSDGTDPFIAGLIEHNLVKNSRGYNLQIKRQDSRPVIEGMPAEAASTIVRHNVFLKGPEVGEDGARPSVLVGGLPDEGPGSRDRYEIYGNVFCGAAREALLQACGDVTIHDNLFLNAPGTAITLMRHEHRQLVRAWVYDNTFFAVGTGVRFVDRPRDDHVIAGNLMLGGHLARGVYFRDHDNLVVPAADLAKAVVHASGELGELDLRPLEGACAGPPLSLEPFAVDTDFDRDFDGAPKGEARLRGAYQRTEAPGAWRPADGIKPAGG